jgi:hypothetical protein
LGVVARLVADIGVLAHNVDCPARQRRNILGANR